jgi:hypothetical protein
MTPEQFVGKWRSLTRTEKSAAHEHFLDLCELLDVKKPAESDPHGTEYTFEKSTLKLGDASGMPTLGAKCLLSPPREGIADYMPQSPVSKVIPMFGAPARRAVPHPKRTPP